MLAAKDGKAWQIQVKGATEENGWWFGYGFCTDAVIAQKEPVFNRCSTSMFYKAEIVALVCVKLPKEYCCIILPVEIAERAAQINLDREYRTKKKDGGAKKPGKVWVALDWIPNTKDASRKAFYEDEVKLLKPYNNKWDF